MLIARELKTNKYIYILIIFVKLISILIRISTENGSTVYTFVAQCDHQYAQMVKNSLTVKNELPNPTANSC